MQILQAAYPEAATPQQEALHELLGPINERITARAISLLAEGDAEALGEDTTCIACMDLQRNKWGETFHRRQMRCRIEILCIACVLVQHVLVQERRQHHHQHRCRSEFTTCIKSMHACLSP